MILHAGGFTVTEASLIFDRACPTAPPSGDNPDFSVVIQLIHFDLNSRFLNLITNPVATVRVVIQTDTDVLNCVWIQLDSGSNLYK